MYKSIFIFKRFFTARVFFLVVFTLIFLLAVVRSGPFFCKISSWCFWITVDTPILGPILSLPASTFYTVLGFWVAFLGLGNVVRLIERRAKPRLMITHDKILQLYSINFPLEQEIPLRIINEGNIPLQKGEIYSRILLKRDQYIELTEIIKENWGEFPKVNDVANQPDLIALGGSIPVKIMPHRLNKVFTVKLKFRDAGLYHIKYYFVTDHGFYPENIKVDKNNEPIDNFGILTIQVNRGTRPD